jgi:hypothetical protein
MVSAERAFAGLLVVALTWWLLPGGALAEVPPVEPHVDFVRTYDGMVGVLCARADLARIEVEVDGSPFFAVHQPSGGPSCGPAMAGVRYLVLIGNDVIVAHPGRHSVRIRAVGWDQQVQQVDAPVMLASGAIISSKPSLQWSGSQLRIRGWALDPDSSRPLEVTITGFDRAGVLREFEVMADSWAHEVADRFPGYGGGHGFDVTLPLVNWIRLRAVNPDPMHEENAERGPLFPPNRAAYARMDPVAVEGRRITISGAAVDPDGAVSVAVGINGRLAGLLSVGAGPVAPTSARPWSLSFPVDPGAFDICSQHTDAPSSAFSPLECQHVVVK